MIIGHEIFIITYDILSLIFILSVDNSTNDILFNIY